MILLLTTMVAAAKTDALVTHLEKVDHTDKMAKILVVSTDKVLMSRLDETTYPTKCCPSWVI